MLRCQSPAPASPGVSRSGAPHVGCRQPPRGGRRGRSSRVRCKKGSAERRKQETHRDNGRGGRRTKETVQCRRNTLSHPSSLRWRRILKQDAAQLSPDACSLQSPGRAAGRREPHGRARADRSLCAKIPPFGCFLLTNNNKTTRGARSVKTPVSTIAQREPEKD